MVLPARQNKATGFGRDREHGLKWQAVRAEEQIDAIRHVDPFAVRDGVRFTRKDVERPVIRSEDEDHEF